MYAFGRLDAQLRRNWLDDNGSLAIIAGECRWIKLSYVAARLVGSLCLIAPSLYFPKFMTQYPPSTSIYHGRTSPSTI
ncbi:uncharacterized protein BT62DRAFT_926244 [Guyanagaster necrorhizus]|uniref:Uncharacterized protein n=1 Tax=Guyanagaster necrorhizus TaxID=856835 RepID=A0A9P7W3M0_9AGAR|nr:uncharacterized protein BT62DRAFT_926244 [Guyanagaster necrorhizus MCA 3950]KAG7452027.1 hypothetical protein BT62DRAFT_926244 [Guyanagaster necrorhizus MCA 3950]